MIGNNTIIDVIHSKSLDISRSNNNNLKIFFIILLIWK